MQYTSREVYEYISKQTNDPIVEWKTCAVAGVEFPIYESDYNFYNKISPTFAGTKFQIPTPSLCPEERQRRRLLFRNERRLYRRTCDFSGKEIISIYSPDKPYKVYDQKVWWSDQRDPMNYGRDFDFSKTFGENFADISQQIPHIGLIISSDATDNNCSYVNFAGRNKDCYLIFDSDFNEDCYYSNLLKQCKNCVDCSFSVGCQESWQLLFCVGCYNCKNCKYTTQSQFCEKCVSCIACEHCYNCFGLMGKKYCVNNIQYLQESYEKMIGSGEDLSVIKPALHITIKDCEQTIGSSLMNSKKVSFTFDGGNLEDTKYCSGLFDAKDCFDVDSFGDNLTMSYESLSCGHSVFRSNFSILAFANSTELYYCQECPSCSYCFGCIGLRNNQFCIFNKQYTKQEYEQLVGMIIRHMQMTGERGEFFHPSLSPFGYNETIAQDYLPLSLEQSLERNYKRQDNNYDPKIPDNVKVIKPLDYTNEQRIHLRADDELPKQIIICTESGRPFRILKQELDFYRKHDLSLPTLHPDIRHEHRMKLRPGRTLYLRNCDKCDSQMLSVYAQDYDGKVYCETCYQKEVYA